MGTLVVRAVDFNDSQTVERFQQAIAAILWRRHQTRRLGFKPGYYFETPDGKLPSEPGWYVIMGQGRPVYVGQAADLNARLNSNQGTLDNFAKRGRVSDDERNFVKKFNEIGILNELGVAIITERDLCQEPGIARPLSSLDRNNVEKALNLLRCMLPLVPSDIPEHVQ